MQSNVQSKRVTYCFVIEPRMLSNILLSMLPIHGNRFHYCNILYIGVIKQVYNIILFPELKCLAQNIAVICRFKLVQMKLPFMVDSVDHPLEVHFEQRLHWVTMHTTISL